MSVISGCVFLSDGRGWLEFFVEISLRRGEEYCFLEIKKKPLLPVVDALLMGAGGVGFSWNVEFSGKIRLVEEKIKTCFWDEI